MTLKRSKKQVYAFCAAPPHSVHTNHMADADLLRGTVLYSVRAITCVLGQTEHQFRGRPLLVWSYLSSPTGCPRSASSPVARTITTYAMSLATPRATFVSLLHYFKVARASNYRVFLGIGVFHEFGFLFSGHSSGGLEFTRVHMCSILASGRPQKSGRRMPVKRLVRRTGPD